MATQLPSKKGHSPHPILGPCLLWLNGWMDQDATWYGGTPRPRRRCVRRGPSCPLKGAPKRSTAPVLGPCLLWPNGWMDEDATWYGSKSRPRPHCVRRRPSSPHKRGTGAPVFFDPCLLWPRSPISATAKLLFVLFLCYSKLEQWLKICVICADGSFTAVSYIFVRRMLALFVLTPVVHWYFDCIILIVLYIFCQLSLSKRNEGAHRLLCGIDLAF